MIGQAPQHWRRSKIFLSSRDTKSLIPVGTVQAWSGLRTVQLHVAGSGFI